MPSKGGRGDGGEKGGAEGGLQEAAAQGGAWPAYLPLVPMQQGRPLISQSMCRKLVWLLRACSVQICSDGRGST